MRKVTCECIVADTPTVNGRIYPRTLLEKFVLSCNDRLMVITDNLDNGGGCRLSDIIATAQDFSLTEEGRIEAVVEVLPNSRIAEELLEQVNFSPMVIGDVIYDSSGSQVVEDTARVTHFALTPKQG